MKFLKAIAGITAIFILGVLTGILGTGLVVKHRIETFHEKGPPPIKAMFMERLSHQLELNPEQKIRIEAILEDTQKDLNRVRQTFRPRIKQVFSTCFNRIEAQLTPIQQKRFKAMQERFPRFMPHPPFKKQPHHRPPPGDRRPRTENRDWREGGQK
ncbi:MAG: hypothetical protein KGY61_10030 [Desulfobacterales bacterium]|nr:hypothetical protein [Desulfobacterales bacterium]